jgi:cold shock CspA family protein
VLTGIVTALSAHGFGFIAPDRGGGEFWIRPQHGNSNLQQLEKGDAVAFDFRFGELGPEAVNLRRVPA